MEKRISYSDFQQVKSVAKACDPSIRERNKIKAKIEKLVTDYKREEQKISMLEAGIKNIIGFSVEQLVKKVIETDAKGNKVTKYLPTDIVTYDDVAKQYVITLPEENAEADNTELPFGEEQESNEF